jgi:DNA mismatch repair protein MutL
MPKIRKLSAQEAQKIAAGEVVERPANILKELVENAIDAGATKITMYVKDGGKELIRIIDNGCGMSAEDAQLCFEHHATSKISTIEDLSALATFGFRGEALSSIASISKVILITKTEADLCGTRVELSGNKDPIVTETSSNQGTDISIHNIFFNLPARLKFLKKKETEFRHIQQLFDVFALSYPSVHFTLYSEEKQIENAHICMSLEERLKSLWDNQTIAHLLPLVSSDTHGLIIKGFISDHQFYRYDRSLIYFFVNNRWVKNYQLSNALLKGYQHVIPSGRYPAACIFLSVDPKHIDINTHPRKEEVLFLHQKLVMSALQDIVKKTLDIGLRKHLNKKVTFQSAYIPNEFPKKLLHTSNFDKQHLILQKSEDFMQKTVLSDSVMPEQQSSTSPLVEHGQATVLFNEIEKHTVIGIYNNTYILVASSDGMLMIDQHAAHERILYELFSKKIQEIVTVPLLFPIIIHLTKSDVELLTVWISLFIKNGIDLAPFSTDQIIIHAIPLYLKSVNLSVFIKKIIGSIIEYGMENSANITQKISDIVHINMACSAAVKAGDILHEEQIQKLINDLYKTENRFCCPHGRPTSWLILEDDIKKKFKRDYQGGGNNLF